MIKSHYEPFDTKCVQISQADCQKLCNQSNGVLRTVSNEITCVHFRIAKAVCLQLDFSGDEPKLLGGCFTDNALEYYESIKLNREYQFKDLVSL